MSNIEAFAISAGVIAQAKTGVAGALAKIGFDKTAEGLLAAAASVAGAKLGVGALLAAIPMAAPLGGLAAAIGSSVLIAATTHLAGAQLQALHNHKVDAVVRTADAELGRQAVLRGQARTLQAQAGLGAYMKENASQITSAQAQLKLMEQVQAMGVTGDAKRAAAEKQVVQQQITTAQSHLAEAMVVARSEKLLTAEVKARYEAFLPEPAKYVMNRPVAYKTSYTPMVLAKA